MPDQKRADVGDKIMPVDTILDGYVTNPNYPGVKLFTLIFQSQTENMATLPLAFSEPQALDLLEKLQKGIDATWPIIERKPRGGKTN